MTVSMVESAEFGSGGNGFVEPLVEDDFAETTTVYLFLARVRAIWRPIPLEAPITTATCSEVMMGSLFGLERGILFAGQGMRYYNQTEIHVPES